MDILNFIYWVKNKRVITSAPNDALIPIGIKDNRRDDSYLTCAIKASDLGGGGKILDVTYSELYNAVTNGTLVPGTWYRFTYNSVNFLNGWEAANYNSSGAYPSFNAREIYTGEEEVLLVQAVSEYDISEIGYSETYPGDIVQYAPYTNKIGIDFDLYTGQNLPDSTLITDFNLKWDGTNVYFDMPANYPALFGHYFYLYAEFDGGNYYQDGNFEPLTPGIATCQYPYTSDDPDYGYPKAVSRLKVVNGGTKVILLDLDYNDFLNYDTDSLYVQTIYALGDATGWITKRIDTERNISVPFDFRGRKYRRYKTEIYGSLYSINYTATGNTATDNIYHGIAGTVTAGTSGSGATFTVVVSGGAVTSVTISSPGRFYDNTTEFTIYGSQIGGASPADDIVITVNVTSNIQYCVTGTYYNAYPYPTQTTLDDYKDFKCFGEDGNDAYNIDWSGMGGPDMYWYAGYSDNNVFQGSFGDNILKDRTYNNTAIYSMYSNKLSNNFIYNIFIGGYSNVIGNDCAFNVFSGNNNNIKSAFYFNVIVSQFDENNIGYYCYNNFFRDQFVRNDVGNYSQSNFFGLNCTKNTIGNTFVSNKIEDNFSYNSIESDFGNNYLGANFAYNVIGNNFSNNTIGEGFGFGYSTSQGNIIGNYFINNDIGEYFYNNRVADGFAYNTIADSFQLNDVKTAVASQDFTLSTNVYGNYNCDIFRRSDNTLRLSYVDGTDTVIYDTITS